jgi:hypothetical protein
MIQGGETVAASCSTAPVSDPRIRIFRRFPWYEVTIVSPLPLLETCRRISEHLELESRQPRRLFVARLRGTARGQLFSARLDNPGLRDGIAAIIEGQIIPAEEGSFVAVKIRWPFAWSGIWLGLSLLGVAIAIFGPEYPEAIWNGLFCAAFPFVSLYTGLAWESRTVTKRILSLVGAPVCPGAA